MLRVFATLQPVGAARRPGDRWNKASAARLVPGGWGWGESMPVVERNLERNGAPR
jgi:hypothetical protein